MPCFLRNGTTAPTRRSSASSTIGKWLAPSRRTRSASGIVSTSRWLHSTGIGSSFRVDDQSRASDAGVLPHRVEGPRLPIMRSGAACTFAAVIGVKPSETCSIAAGSLKNGMNVFSWWRSSAAGSRARNSSELLDRRSRLVVGGGAACGHGAAEPLHQLAPDQRRPGVQQHQPGRRLGVPGGVQGREVCWPSGRASRTVPNPSAWRSPSRSSRPPAKDTFCTSPTGCARCPAGRSRPAGSPRPRGRARACTCSRGRWRRGARLRGCRRCRRGCRRSRCRPRERSCW